MRGWENSIVIGTKMKMPDLKKDNSISEIVYQAVYKQILGGKIRPGERITEQAIAESMGISRAPVREGLKRLAEDRLVRLVPRSGCFVSDLSAEEIGEIYEIRKRLESMALEYAFDRFDLRQVENLRQRLLDCARLAPASMVSQAVKLDSQLHTIILQYSGCPNLQEMLDKLRARVEIFRVREANYTERARDAVQEHLAILDAILAGDRAKAIRSLQLHVDHTKSNVLGNVLQTRNK